MITLTDARRHLRIDGTQDDAEIQLKLDLATALVDGYIGEIKGDPYPMGTSDAAYELAEVRRFRNRAAMDAAVLLALGDLWAHREASSCNPLSDGVKMILAQLKEPSYA